MSLHWHRIHERERQRQRDRDKETETETETERQRETERPRQRDRDRETERCLLNISIKLIQQTLLANFIIYQCQNSLQLSWPYLCWPSSARKSGSPSGHGKIWNVQCLPYISSHGSDVLLNYVVDPENQYIKSWAISPWRISSAGCIWWKKNNAHIACLELIIVCKWYICKNNLCACFTAVAA